MKFEEAARHLEDLGLVVLMPNGKNRPTRRGLRRRNSVRVVPVRVLERDAMPPDLREMIRQSRAEIHRSSKK